MQESEVQTATRSFQAAAENQASAALHSTAKQAAGGVDLRFAFITRLSVLLSTTLAHCPRYFTRHQQRFSTVPDRRL